MLRSVGLLSAFMVLAVATIPAQAKVSADMRAKVVGECRQLMQWQKPVSRMTYIDNMRTCVRSKLSKA